MLLKVTYQDLRQCGIHCKGLENSGRGTFASRCKQSHSLLHYRILHRSLKTVASGRICALRSRASLSEASQVSAGHSDAVFECMLQQLANWKEAYGSCYVPKQVFDARDLAAWVWHVRAARKNGQLTQEQLHQLDALEFVWKPTVLDSAWHHQFHLLRHWACTHGNPDQLLTSAAAGGTRHRPADSTLTSSSSSSQDVTPAAPIAPAAVHELSVWLARQQQLYRQMRLTPLKVRLMRSAGVKLRRMSGVPRTHLHPVLQGKDPSSYRRRIITVQPATAQGRQAVQQLVGRYRELEELQPQQGQQEAVGMTGRLGVRVESSSSSNSSLEGMTAQDLLDPELQPDPDLRFMLLLSQLQQWKQRYGSSIVPPRAYDKPALALWVHQLRDWAAAGGSTRLRQQQQQQAQLQPSQLPEQGVQEEHEGGCEGGGPSPGEGPRQDWLPQAPWQLEELEATGLMWDPNKEALEWWAHYHQLREFKALTGHLDVAAAAVVARGATATPSAAGGARAAQGDAEGTAVGVQGAGTGDLLAVRGVAAEAETSAPNNTERWSSLAEWLHLQQQQDEQGLLGKGLRRKLLWKLGVNLPRGGPHYEAAEVDYAGPHAQTGHAVYKRQRSKWLRKQQGRRQATKD